MYTMKNSRNEINPSPEKLAERKLKIEQEYLLRKQKVLETIKNKRQLSNGYTLENLRNYQKLTAKEMQKIKASLPQDQLTEFKGRLES